MPQLDHLSHHYLCEGLLHCPCILAPVTKTSACDLASRASAQRLVEAARARVVKQRSPTFLAPGTGFVEDSFSMDGGWGAWGGVVQAVM